MNKKTYSMQHEAVNHASSLLSSCEWRSVRYFMFTNADGMRCYQVEWF